MAGREPTIIGTNKLIFNHETLKQIIELFLNNNLFKGGAVNMVQVDSIEQGRFRDDPEDPNSSISKQYTVAFRNMNEVNQDG